MNKEFAEMKNSKNNLNVPNLRFPEFIEEWERYHLSDIADIIGGGTPNTSVSEYWGGNIQWFTPSEIGKEKYVSLSERTISDIGLKNSSAKILPQGAVLLSTRATIGECSITLNECTTNQGFQSLVAKINKVTSEFLYYLVSTIKKEMLRRSCGSTFLEISSSELKKIRVNIPFKVEQNKITALLALLDQRIETQKKIIEDLKKLKSEISKLLFSRTDLLENKITISEIGVLKNGYAFQSSSYNADGSYQILTISNVTGERYICSEGCNRVFAKPSDIQPHQELMTDDILISLTGNVGRVSLCKEGMYLLNQRVGLLQLNTGVNREYVYQAISTRRFEQSMISCGQGAAQMNIGKRDVEGYLIPYTNNPTNLYQISSILKSYDELIFIESRRLQLLYSQKRYFLVQMFI